MVAINEQHREKPFGVDATRGAYANALQAYLLACRESKAGRIPLAAVKAADEACERAARDYSDALQGLRPATQREFLEITPEMTRT
jgi:hypothetical protein